MTSTLKLGSKIPISEIEGDIATNDDLSLKANTSMNNIPAAGKEEVNAWGMPDFTRGINKTWNTSNTAECDGWIYGTVVIDFQTGGFCQVYLYINGNRIGMLDRTGSGEGDTAFCFYPVKKGDTYYISSVGGQAAYTSSASIKFYPNLGGI